MYQMWRINLGRQWVDVKFKSFEEEEARALMKRLGCQNWRMKILQDTQRWAKEKS